VRRGVHVDKNITTCEKVKRYLSTNRCSAGTTFDLFLVEINLSSMGHSWDIYPQQSTLSASTTIDEKLAKRL
jgi:hypothetical protein